MSDLQGNDMEGLARLVGGREGGANLCNVRGAARSQKTICLNLGEGKGWRAGGLGF